MRTLNVRRRPPASLERHSFVLVSSCALACSGSAAAQEQPAPVAEAPQPAAAKPAPYWLPWQLPIDEPKKKADYEIVQLDLPFTF